MSNYVNVYNCNNANNVYPSTTVWTEPNAPGCCPFGSFSWAAQMLNFIEGNNIYNSINFIAPGLRGEHPRDRGPVGRLDRQSRPPGQPGELDRVRHGPEQLLVPLDPGHPPEHRRISPGPRGAWKDYGVNVGTGFAGCCPERLNGGGAEPERRHGGGQPQPQPARRDRRDAATRSSSWNCRATPSIAGSRRTRVRTSSCGPTTRRKAWSSRASSAAARRRSRPTRTSRTREGPWAATPAASTSRSPTGTSSSSRTASTSRSTAACSPGAGGEVISSDSY